MVGLILNGFFADSAIISLDGVSTTASGGFLNKNWALLYKQICYVLAIIAYTFVVSALIAKTIDMIPGLNLRAGPASEALGMDEVEVCADCLCHGLPLIRLFTAWRICHRLY